MRDLWWTKWHWDRFFLKYFGFPPSVSFHRLSITRERTKITIIFTFITGLHKEPYGCGAPVASAAETVSAKKIHFTVRKIYYSFSKATCSSRKIVFSKLLKSENNIPSLKHPLIFSSKKLNKVLLKFEVIEYIRLTGVRLLVRNGHFSSLLCPDYLIGSGTGESFHGLQ
jgi:hypothetical protein